MHISEFQELIARTFGERDAARGVAASVAWLTEEVGELSRALRKGTNDERREEFADVMAWLVSLAHQVGVDLDAAVRDRYGDGCPKCGSIPCRCD